MGDRPNLASWLPALLGGVLAGWAMAPPAWWPLQLAAVPLLWLALALLWRQQARPGARRRSAAWGALAVIVSHRWLLALHPLDWIGVPLPLSLPICWLLLLFCGGLAALLLLIWSGLAPLVDADLPRAATLAAATPIEPPVMIGIKKLEMLAQRRLELLIVRDHAPGNGSIAEHVFGRLQAGRSVVEPALGNEPRRGDSDLLSDCILHALPVRIVAATGQ
jgi:hypothetical protein